MRDASKQNGCPFVKILDKLLPLAPLGWQADFLKKLGVSRVVAQIFE
jgi:hypothetical protein